MQHVGLQNGGSFLVLNGGAWCDKTKKGSLVPMSDDFDLFGDDDSSAAPAGGATFFDDDDLGSDSPSSAGAPPPEPTISPEERVKYFLDLFGVNAAVQSTIRKGALPVAESVESLVKETSSWVNRFPPFDEKLSGDAGETMPSILVEHWRNLYSANFDTNYIASAQQLGFMLQYLNLGATWYQAMAAFGTDQALRILKNRKDFPSLALALNQAAQMDVSLVAHDYFEAAKQARSTMVQNLASAFERSISSEVDKVNDMATLVMKKHAQEMMERLAQMDFETVSMAAAAEEAAYSVDSIARNTAGLAGSLENVRNNVMETADAANEAAREALQTDNAMHGLLEVASHIGSIGATIDAIARQTRMLALNATIEAARAGEAGRGFAVVAQEIKKLSEQTSRATNDIATSVRGAVEATNQAVETIQKTVSAVNAIADVASHVCTDVVSQTNAIKDIASHVEEAASGARAVTTSVKSAIEALSISSAVAGTLNGAADQLATEAGHMREEVAQYLNGLRSMT